MYATKIVHKNYVDPATCGYITIGDNYQSAPENPFRQAKKGEKAPTPFQIKMRPQNAENGNFSKLECPPGDYHEAIIYRDAQPLDARKRGFGSKDAKRRDEFANAIRTEQYRSTISKESLTLARSSGQLQATLSRIMDERAQTSPVRSAGTNSFYASSVPQYDIGRARVTPFDPKSMKDTFYKFDQARDKRFGDHRPASSDFGSTAWEISYGPPGHGGKSETKKFWDKSHLMTSTI